MTNLISGEDNDRKRSVICNDMGDGSFDLPTCENLEQGFKWVDEYCSSCVLASKAVLCDQSCHWMDAHSALALC